MESFIQVHLALTEQCKKRSGQAGSHFFWGGAGRVWLEGAGSRKYCQEDKLLKMLMHLTESFTEIYNSYYTFKKTSYLNCKCNILRQSTVRYKTETATYRSLATNITFHYITIIRRKLSYISQAYMYHVTQNCQPVNIG